VITKSFHCKASELRTVEYTGQILIPGIAPFREFRCGNDAPKILCFQFLVIPCLDEKAFYGTSLLEMNIYRCMLCRMLYEIILDHIICHIENIKYTILSTAQGITDFHFLRIFLNQGSCVQVSMKMRGK
jgi:hypothetical protein